MEKGTCSAKGAGKIGFLPTEDEIRLVSFILYKKKSIQNGSKILRPETPETFESNMGYPSRHWAGKQGL